MSIKVVGLKNQFFPHREESDCIALRRIEDSPYIEIAFPYHEDTPNFKLTIAEAMDLKNALDQLLVTKLLENPRRI